MNADLTRRDFFSALGCGVVILCAAESADAQESGRRSRNDARPQSISAWLHIGDDGTVTACTGKAEVGQNIRTSLAQAVAEELRVPLASIKLLMADTDLTPYDMGTFGSRTTPTMGPQLRNAAGSARLREHRPVAGWILRQLPRRYHLQWNIRVLGLVRVRWKHRKHCSRHYGNTRRLSGHSLWSQRSGRT